MQKAAHHFKHWVLIFSLLCFPLIEAANAAELKRGDTGTYQDVFDQNVYYEGTNFLRFDRLYRAIFDKKARSENVNSFDEVPDNSLFTNRHSRNRLSSSELEKGPELSGKPAGKWMVLNGKFLDGHSGIIRIQDSSNDEYELRFDTFDQFELATASEVIASRFYHAIGFNVPAYSIVAFDFNDLTISPDATVIDRSGFERKLTMEKLQELMLFLPMDQNAKYRASARKILKGTDKGTFKFQGRSKNNPGDTVDHENRRDVRALRVFASWLNHYSVNESNTMSLLSNENGGIKHYLINFNTALGSEVDGAKPPMFSHEFLMDYGETTKAFLSLGIWEKPWQKRWKEAGEKIHPSPAIGYFDNRMFDAGKFKPELPYYAFKDLTAGDGFWAAKIIASFSDEDIASAIKAGELSKTDDQNYLIDILKNRRDMVAKYWFSKTAPLDNFKLENNVLSFDDLAVRHGFENSENTRYHIDVLQKAGKKYKKAGAFESSKPAFEIANWIKGGEASKFVIRVSRNGSIKKDAKALIKAGSGGILKIAHHG